MNKKEPANVAASVRQRLLNISKERKEEFQFILTRYAIERLLHRLSVSKYADDFTLKGAVLFQLWTGAPHRSTLDLDLLGSGDDAVARFESIFREIFVLRVEADGLVFLPESIKGEPIREDQRYGGVRIRGVATLERARIPLQIDIGIGDVVTPKALTVSYPTLLKMPAPSLKAYPKETVVAEKCEAMIALGIANSRMKDFYDLWVICTRFEFDGPLLVAALSATFKRRGTEFPATTPIALTSVFTEDHGKYLQWIAFVRRGALAVEVPEFKAVIELLHSFLAPALDAARGNQHFIKKWSPGGPWY